MNPENIKQSIQAVIDGITPLAQKMQVPIEHIWSWCVKHNYAIAASEIILFLLVLILYFPLKSLWKFAQKESEKHTYSSWDSHAALITVLYWAMLFITGLILIFGAVPRLIAPEYSTAKDLMNLVRGNSSNQ